MSEKVSRAGVFSDATKTLVLPLIAYSAVFAFEAGYCYWFGIPVDFIRLDATRFLVFGTAIAALIFALTPGIAIFYGASHKVPPPQRAESTFAIGLLLVGVATLAMFFASGLRPLPALGMLLGYFFILIPDIVAAFRMSKETSFLQRLITLQDRSLTTSQASWGSTLNMRPPLIALCFVLYLWLLAWNVGQTTARYQRKFLCIGTDSATTVVLRVYGDRLICADVNNETRKVASTFSILDLSKESKVSLALKPIGPLTADKDQESASPTVRVRYVDTEQPIPISAIDAK